MYCADISLWFYVQTSLEKYSFQTQRSFQAWKDWKKVHRTRVESSNHCGKINPQCLNCWTFSLSGGGDDDDNRVVCVLAHNKKWYTKASSSVVVCVLLKTFSEANFHAFLWGWLRTTLNDVPRYFSSSFALSQSSWNNFFLSWQWIFCFKQQKWLNRNFSFAPYTASICMCVCLNNFENLRKNICIMTSHPCDN